MKSKIVKLKGSVNSKVGGLKKAVGRATGNKSLEAKGSIQKTKGKAQKLGGAIQGTFEKGKDLLGIK